MIVAATMVFSLVARSLAQVQPGVSSPIPQQSPSHQNTGAGQTNVSFRSCLVLDWHDRVGWWGLDSVDGCAVTSDRKRLQEAAVVVFTPQFHEPDLPPPESDKLSGQVWAVIAHEAPTQLFPTDKLATSIIGIDMWSSHDPRSDWMDVYPSPSSEAWNRLDAVRRRPRRLGPEASTAVAQVRGTISVGVAISNCANSKTPRLPFVRRMLRRLELQWPAMWAAADLRGQCLGRQMDEDRVGQRAQLLETTMFSVGFENTFYPGYVTEKLIDAIAAGAVPLVMGGARFSDFVPRAMGDPLGSHPVFIDAAAFHSPEEAADYLGWLAETGKVDNYRPWLRCGNATGETGTDECAKRPKPAGWQLRRQESWPGTAGNLETGLGTDTGWPCLAADVVRCGMSGFSSVVNAGGPFGERPAQGLLRLMGRRPDERRETMQQLAGAGDRGLAEALRLPLERVRALDRPWLSDGADPTLAEFRAEQGTGQPLQGAVGPEEVLLDTGRCRCGTAEAWCIAREPERLRFGAAVSTAEHFRAWAIPTPDDGSCRPWPPAPHTET